MTVPPGVRPPAYSQHFETIETRVPAERIEPVEPAKERQDIAVIGPIAALVLALTISTLVLDHPAARAVAAGLATLGLIVAVVLMLLGKRPEPGRHVARHATERRPG
ncbi:hypothetical protein [Lentzea flava]|uniref:hypothetical protein n=1 Tax=Lentzea flava TaxID=103732 RepID=UPI00166FADBA|nr:hypothetical protein [Lentzea flava]